MSSTIKGTVKVGRWTYPAAVDVKAGTGTRTANRDGSGELINLDAKAIESFTSEDFTLAREIYTRIFEMFAVVGEEIVVGGVTEARAHELARWLTDNTKLVVREQRVDDATGRKEWLYQSFKTYDDHKLEEVLADFDAAVPRTLSVTARKASKPVNNTHAKPGRSTWALGDACAQGKHVLTETNRYVMPSGRVQCRDCRSGYPSNI